MSIALHLFYYYSCVVVRRRGSIEVDVPGSVDRIPYCRHMEEEDTRLDRSVPDRNSLHDIHSDPRLFLLEWTRIDCLYFARVVVPLLRVAASYGDATRGVLLHNTEDALWRRWTTKSDVGDI